MIEAIREMKREGLGLLVSEQNLDFARLVAERVYVIEKGVHPLLRDDGRNSTRAPMCATPISRCEVGMKRRAQDALEGGSQYRLDDQVGFVLRQAQQRHTNAVRRR